jgi:glycosyltransferase involved in cell wall biosynthesis
MPVYNCAGFVGAAIESMLKQTLTDFELIVIDDHSTDGTKEIIAGFNNSRIVFVGKPCNTGLVESLNMGFKLAKGKYIARMDGDDISDVNRLEKQVQFLDQHSDIALCGTAYELMANRKIMSYPAEHENIKLAMLNYCPFGHPTVMIRKSFIDANHLQYNNEFECAEDYELWVRCVWLGKTANIPEVLLYYREHANQSSKINNYNQAKNSALCRIKMLQKVWDKASVDDKYTRELLFQREIFGGTGDLEQMLQWMDTIEASNIKKSYFEPSKFSQYILAKKLGAIRRFYLHQTLYNPGVLYKFLTSGKLYLSSFTRLESLKLAVKCLIFWRNKAWQINNN